MINCYQVWMEGNRNLFIAAKTHLQAKFLYLEATGLDRHMSGFQSGLHCHLIERDVEFSAGEINPENIERINHNAS